MKPINELKDTFEKLKTQSLHKGSTVYGSGLWEKWHDLADVQYQPAKEFFIERLQDSRADWRTISVNLLGFHYDLDPGVLEKIRNMLLSDLDSSVRLACAAVLGQQSELPDKSLVYALKHDSDRHVVISSFSALLELANVPYKIRLNELSKVDSGEITPNLSQIKHILADCKIDALIE